MSAAGDDDIALLREVPGRMLRLGYVDAYLMYGMLHMRTAGLRHELAALSSDVRLLCRLFALGEAVIASDLDRLLGKSLVDALLRLHVLLPKEPGLLHTGGVCLVPTLGRLALIPLSSVGPAELFGDDTAALAVRLAVPPGARCLDLCAGPGVLALRLADSASQVVAIETRPAARACAELNFAMNAVEARVELRAGGPEAVAADERFDHVSANPPLLAFPPVLFAPDGETETMTERVLRGLSGWLQPTAVAQVVAAGVGGEAGPRALAILRQQSEQHGLSASVTVTGQTALTPGSSLLRALAINVARVQSLPVEQVEASMLGHLAEVSADRLFLFHLTACLDPARAGVQVSRADTLGPGYWFRS